MSSSIDTIGMKLQTLEERLQAENDSRMVFSQLPTPRQVPRPQQLETTPIRPRKSLNLPVVAQHPAAETETDKKLKKIMKQTGILTINNQSYKTDIKDLKHLGDLGNGTSGHVVKMQHIPSGTVIAVKQMRRTGNTEENKRILMDLDVVLKSHDCQYIVQCLGCFVRDPDVWICMELMAMCFDKLLKLSKKPVPEDILGKVTVATVKALSYLKEKHGVIHRDVKPSNILIDERGNIKLCDFGISGRLVDSKANTRSAGCAAYMAPERIDPKKPKYDIRADVWSLGITLVELATARSPYEGCNTDFEVLTKVLDSDPPSLPKDKGFSIEFHNFVTKCLTKNHQERPKYPELLEQPFIKTYEITFVDVPYWFRSVVEASGIRTHQRMFMSNNFTKTEPKADFNTDTFNSKTKHMNSSKISQIPSYQYYLTTSGNKTLAGSSLFHHNYQKEVRPPQLCLPQTTSSNLKNNSERLKKDDEIHKGAQEFNKTSPFMQRKFGTAQKIVENARKESMFSTIGQSIIRNLKTSPFAQKKSQSQLNRDDVSWKLTNSQSPDLSHRNNLNNELIQQSPVDVQKKSHSIFNSSTSNRETRSFQQPSVIKGNQSPIVLQRFYHQQNQYREKEQFSSDCSSNPFINSYDLNCQTSLVPNSTKTFLPSTSSQSLKHTMFHTTDGKNYCTPTINDHYYHPNNNLGNCQTPSFMPDNSTLKASTFADSQQMSSLSVSNECNSKNECGAIKRQFSSYIKRQLDASHQIDEINKMGKVQNSRNLLRNSELEISGRTALLHNDSTTTKSTITATPYDVDDNPNEIKQRSYVQSSNPHILTSIDRRHRSPDPPPRYNRGQSPLLLRKNLLELSGQPPGSPLLLNRRLMNVSPPLPPPRRGSESVPGSPQHFRTRIHYTPEPQRRIYRTIDQ